MYKFNTFKDELSDDTSSVSDPENPHLSSSEMLLKFPEEDTTAHLISTRDNNSSEEELEQEDLPRSGVYFDLPATLGKLRKELLHDYRHSDMPPAPIMAQELTRAEMLSLKHYVAWKKSNGTVLAYRLHAQVLQSASGIEILSLYSTQKLARSLTDLHPSQVDMCPQSCLAYEGEFAEMETCPYTRNGKVCGEPRYKAKGCSTAQNKPRAQMMCLPVMATIKAMFANADTSKLLRHRDKCLQEALHLVATAPEAVKYSDFCDSKVHMHHHQSMGLFQDPRDIAFALSTDGAQLTMKRQSDTWLLILMVLNLPPEMRYKSFHVIHPMAIPGPNPPGNIESYLFTLFKEMAMASDGIWMWDAVDSSYFLNHACICMALGDMLGSAKLNGMAGHSAIYGDRFSMVKGARASLKKGSKAQYYPISPPQNSTFNPERPQTYDLYNLPMRQEDLYWKTIEGIQGAKSKTHCAAITKETGISHMPLCAASPAFLHPTFFPLDPFHLFYENCMAFLWDLWTTLSPPSDPIHINADKARKLGQLVSEAMSTLPSIFCGPVRDPFLKRQSQYKIYEWMALLHWYIIPIGIELEFNPVVLENFSHFVEAVERAMTVKPRSEDELRSLHQLLCTFLEGFQRIYIGDDPEKISRFQLCIFQLIHVPIHIQWNGSIRVGSQATVERAIGEVGHKIRSKKAPFANLANIIFERELVKLLLLYYPELDSSPLAHQANIPTRKNGLHVEMKILKREIKSSQEFHQHIHAICDWLNIDFDPELELRRWGKFRLQMGHILRSRLSETQGKHPSRSARYFEAQNDGSGKIVFGEALAFFEVQETNDLVVVYQPLTGCEQQLNRWRGVWSNKMEVLPVSKVTSIVGIWCHKKFVYILRKHPGLTLLNVEETGKGDEDEDENVNVNVTG